ncbi:MAG: hypothetical protein WCI05_01630 [Myxococcales bacterium]
MPHPLARIAVLFTLASLLVGPVTLAADADDKQTALALLADVAKQEAARSATASAVARAKAALERADRMRASGDYPHASLADGLARSWAEVARDLARAVGAERRASKARQATLDASVQQERERALVEDGIARIGRLKAQIEEANRHPSARTATPNPARPAPAPPPKGRR